MSLLSHICISIKTENGNIKIWDICACCSDPLPVITSENEEHLKKMSGEFYFPFLVKVIFRIWVLNNGVLLCCFIEEDQTPGVYGNVACSPSLEGKFKNGMIISIHLWNLHQVLFPSQTTTTRTRSSWMTLWRSKKTVHAHIILEDFIEMEVLKMIHHVTWQWPLKFGLDVTQLTLILVFSISKFEY